MKFKIIVNKKANFFFFVSNLSEWSPYCRKDYSVSWLKNNPLDRKEKNALAKLNRLLKEKKYKLINPLLTSVDENGFWGNVLKILSVEERTVFKEWLNIFEKRFEKLWLKEEKNLEKAKDNLAKNFLVSDKLVALIKKLYGGRTSPKSISIFLFTSPDRKHLIGGGSGFGANGISLECSKITKNNNKNNMLARVILHEITHAFFEKRLIDKIKTFISSEYFENKYKNLILKSSIYKQVKSIIGPIKELILTSFLPEGYLAENFFGLNVIKNLKMRKSIKESQLEKNYYDLMLFGVLKMYKIAKNYSDNQEPIDKKYIEEAIKYWIEFERTDLRKLKI